MKSLTKLYKSDSKGKTRVWWVDLDADKYRVVSGLIDGKLVESGWKTAKPKNVGKVNGTTGEEQAELEAGYLYTKKKDQENYFEDINDIGSETYFSPMLATRFDQLKEKDWIQFKSRKIRMWSQPKLDGKRNVTKADGQWSRKGKPQVSSPHVFADLETTFINAPLFVVDGELYNHDFAADFNSIQSYAQQKKPTEQDIKNSEEFLQYHVYDVYNAAKPGALFSERLEYMNQVGSWAGASIKIVESTEVFNMEDIDRLQAEYLRDGYEGQILRLDAPYEIDSRPKTLIKRKEFFDAEFEIVEIQEGTGNWAGKAKAVVCKLPDGRLFGSGIRGTMPQMEKLFSEKDMYVGSEATIRYPNLTPDTDEKGPGVPRFGIAVAIYLGKRFDNE